MALVGHSSAVVNLGMSCQTARQIEKNKSLFEAFFEEPMSTERFYFDSIIASVGGAAELLKSGLFFPEKEELVLRNRVCWPERDLYFWHGFASETRSHDFSIDAFYERERQKFLYLASKLERLRDRQRILIVLSNTQNTLPSMHQEADSDFPLVVKASELNRLKESADFFFGRKTEMLFATRSELYVPDAALDGIRVHAMTPDDTLWEGDEAQWAGAIADFLSAVEPAAPIESRLLACA